MPQLRVLIHLRIDMAVHNQQIFPSVVVVVEEAIAKSDERKSRSSATPSLIADIGEVSRPIVLKDNVVVVGESGVHQIHVPVVLIIAGGDAHVGHLAAVSVQRIAARVTLISNVPSPLLM